GRREGPVYLRVVDEDGDTCRVRLDLDAHNHERAISAYRSNQLIAFRGLLRWSARSCRVEALSDFQILPASPQARPASRNGCRRNVPRQTPSQDPLARKDP